MSDRPACYTCAKHAAEEGAGWVLHTPPKCRACKLMIERLREGEERKRR